MADSFCQREMLLDDCIAILLPQFLERRKRATLRTSHFYDMSAGETAILNECFAPLRLLHLDLVIQVKRLGLCFLLVGERIADWLSRCPYKEAERKTGSSFVFPMAKNSIPVRKLVHLHSFPFGLTVNRQRPIFKPQARHPFKIDRITSEQRHVVSNRHCCDSQIHSADSHSLFTQ